MPVHPFDQLTLRDGVLMRMVPPLPDAPYLDTPPLRVTGKDQLVELPQGDVSYMFTLNHRVDEAWTELFTSQRDGLAAEVHGAQLEIRCHPADLERTYAGAKELLARTNRGYVEQKAEVSARVAELDAERRAAMRTQGERSHALREQFDRLVL
jgi:hypothetical protein